MSNIHITLVGGQTTPVYQGIMSTNPDKVILIHSEQTENEAKRIKNEVRFDCELYKFDPVDLNIITEDLNKLKNSFSPEDNITVNVSSGTKNWSLLFFSHYRDIARIFLIDQNNRIWDLTTNESSEISFDMDAQFRLLGNELNNYHKLEDFTEADKNMIKEIRELRKFNFSDFFEITDYLSRFQNQTIAKGKDGSELQWNRQEKIFAVRMKNKQGKELQKVLKSEHVRDLVLNTGWFEYETALMLSKWDKAKQFRMNCIFPAKSGSPKNEIDIIINTGTKLLFVECKTQIKNETDIDKFASAVRNYGGLGSKALFVTDAPMNEKAQEKCNEHDIMTFCMENHLWGESAVRLLYEMLNRELMNINPK